MVSVDHKDAQMYFDRDVQCIRTYFQKRYHFLSEEFPSLLDDINVHTRLDRDVEASGFIKEDVEGSAEEESSDESEDSDDDSRSDDAKSRSDDANETDRKTDLLVWSRWQGFSVCWAEREPFAVREDG